MARRKLSRPRLGLALTLALVIPVLSACGTTSTSPSTAASAPPAASQPATSAEPSASAAAGGTLHRRLGRPVLQRQRLDHPDGPGRRRPLVQQDLQPPDDVRSPRRRQAGRRLRCQLRRLRELTGDLAESWEISSDQLTWTFKLRPGVTWHDGEPFTAERRQVHHRALLQRGEHDAPVRTTWRPSTASWASTSTRPAPRPRSPASRSSTTNTISFTFIDPNSLFPTSISELFILPEHTVGQIPLESMKEAEYWKTSQIGTGPFKWTKYTAGQSTELAAFDNYWRGEAQARPDHPTPLPGSRRGAPRVRRG